jgi:hypothetical protein
LRPESVLLAAKIIEYRKPMPRTSSRDAGRSPKLSSILSSFALNFAHLAPCAAAILARAAAESLLSALPIAYRSFVAASA